MTYKCEICNVTLKSKGSHEKSKKHKSALEQDIEKVKDPIDDEEDEIEIDPEVLAQFDLYDFVGYKKSNELPKTIQAPELISQKKSKVSSGDITNIPMPEEKEKKINNVRTVVSEYFYDTTWFMLDGDKSMNSPEVGPQQTSFNHMDEVNDDIPVKYKNYTFGSYQDHDAFIDTLMHLTEERRMFFECLRAGRAQAMFTEMDGELPYGELELNEVQILEHWHNLMVQVSNTLHLGLDAKKWRYTTASKGAKLSLHIVYADASIAFANCDEQKLFWAYVHEVMSKDYPWLCGLTKINYKDKNDTYRWSSIMDLSVYTANRAIRTMYSHKEKSDRYL